MRIEKLHLSESITKQYGIEPININRLGSVVALVGRNGSGKTRILNILKNDYPSSLSIVNIFDESLSHLPKNLSDVREHNNSSYNQTLKEYVRVLQIDELIREKSSNESLVQEKNTINNKFASYQYNPARRDMIQQVYNLPGTIYPIIQSTLKKYIIKIDSSKIRALQSSIPAVNNVQQRQQQTTPIIPLANLIKDIAQQDNGDELESIYNTALPFLTSLSHTIVGDFLESQQDESFNFNESTTNKQFISLQRIVKAFLNKTLSWDKEKVERQNSMTGVTLSSKGILKLNGRIFNYNELSDGEKTLFAYCILFFILDMNPTRKIKDSIIIIDEPELNLHPESEIEVINGIRKIIENSGQLWIATHSLSILSSLNYDEIFMVKDNEIIPPQSSTPPNALIELMGLHGHQERLSNFLSNISNWSYENFMIQCFNEPDTIQSAQPNDPQVEVFKKFIKDTLTGALLDFGAGKGRVLKEIVTNESLTNKLQLFALEPSDKNIEELKKLNLKKYYKTYKELPDNSFDFILLCNVLHEININDWVPLLRKLKSSLKENGYIILLEDMVLPKGERISPPGFIILDKESLKILFGMNSEPITIIPSDRHYKDRILCSPIQKSQITGIDDVSLKKALETLQENTLRKILDLRNKDVPKNELHTLGRKSAFYTQQFTNAHLAFQQIP